MVKEIAHADRAHALLSASGVPIWGECTPSARLGEQFEDTTSIYAEEGTLAHEISELMIRKYFIEPISKKAYTTRLNKLKKKTYKDEPLFQEEMLKHAETYLDYLKGLTLSFKTTPYVAIEKRVDFSAYVPEGFGTGDCIIIGGDTMYINDLKYGKGIPVSAEDNPQLKLYALGAYLEYSFLYPIKTVQLAIIQPRLDNISEYTLSIEELLAWGEEIKPIAQKAFDGVGDYVPGEHCKFCKAKAQCRARADQYSALDDFEQKKPPLLSDEEVGQILEKGQNIEAWVKALKEYALTQSLQGKEIPGWKAVEGRGSRNYVDQDKAFEHLKKNGIDEAVLYERIPLTVPKLEKELGKTEYKSLLEEAGHVQKSSGKPTLAPVSDKREAVKLNPDASEDFK